MPKRILQGVVTSDKNEQTITVLVERRFKHPLLQKTVRKSKKYRAHDEHNKLRPPFGTNETLGRLQIMTVPKGRE
jgi:small subunit ribosomal protein S17